MKNDGDDLGTGIAWSLLKGLGTLILIALALSTAIGLAVKYLL